jgi:predicted nucleic acid-binding protein
VIGYADTSALLKLVHPEAESGALRDWLAQHRAHLLTNSVGVVELVRDAARSGESAVSTARALADRVTVIRLTGDALELAAGIHPASVRTLDALHFASALMVADLDVLVGYDRRMLDAARVAGLTTVSPGW